MLNHLPSMMHVAIALPISIQPTGQKLLTIIPSYPSPPRQTANTR